MRKPMTPKQRQILRYIEQCNQTRGFPPTLREIGAAFEIKSTYGVRYHLDVLERAGYLERDKGTRRGLRLAGRASHRSLSLPLLGQVPAGAPSLAEQEPYDSDNQLVIDQDLFHLSNPEDGFCLKVKGDSMIDIGIRGNDLAVVRRQESAENGDIVVALLNDEATVKRFEQTNGHPVLYPANPDFSPIVVQEEDRFHILGRVVGILRAMGE